MPDAKRTSWHQQWLALDDEYARELEVWATALAQLEGEPGWFALSEEARADAERDSGLTDIHHRLEAMDSRLRRELRFLPTAPAQSVDGVVANLRIAERLVAPEENRLVHDLIVRAVRDLSGLERAS